MFAMREVESSCVHSVGYDPTQAVLAVRLKDKDAQPAAEVRYYRDVPAPVAEGFSTARSAGKHWLNNVRGHFDYDVVSA